MNAVSDAVFFSHAEIDAWIAEDAGLIDLTTCLLGLGAQPARIGFSLRQDGVAAATEEAARVLRHCGAQATPRQPSGQRVAAGGLLLQAWGDAGALLRGWKVAQNLLEYACGVASATARMVDAVHAVAPGVAVLTTRKHAPGLRKLALKATLAGGALPHRLGLGETVLVFPQHRALLDDWPALGERLQGLGGAVAEKTLVVEAHNLAEAEQALAAGAQVLQFDKATPAQLTAWCIALRGRHPAVRLLAAGGIHAGNAADYAACGVDALVTSSLHHAPPADVGVQVMRG